MNRNFDHICNATSNKCNIADTLSIKILYKIETRNHLTFCCLPKLCQHYKAWESLNVVVATSCRKPPQTENNLINFLFNWLKFT